MRTGTLTLTNGETLRFNLELPPGWCGICQRELPEEAKRLTVDVLFHGQPEHVTACHPCLSEYAPELYEMLEDELRRQG